MSNKCTLKTNGAMHYKAKRVEIDENIPSKKLQFQDILFLEENDEVIINRIGGIAIYDDATKLLITDDANRIVVLYDYTNGKILKVIDTKNQNNEWHKHFIATNTKAISSARDDFKFIPISEYSKYGIGDDGKKLTKMHYFIPKIINNRIIISNLIYTFAVADSEKVFNIINRSGFSCFDRELNFEKMIIPEVKVDDYFIYGSYTILNNGDIIGTTSNFVYNEKFASDSLVTVARYDSTGKFIANIGYLPDQYSKNNLIYEELWKPLITNIGNEIFIAYPRLNEIYSPNQKIKFKLKNLPFSNDSGLVYLYNYYRIAKMQKRIPDSKEIGKLLPQTIVYTFNSFGNYGVIILVFDESEPMGFYYIAQEYDIQGNLISQTKFYDEPENQIREFYFDEISNNLCLIKKSKKGWSIEKRKWL